MKKESLLINFEDNWVTDRGAWFAGERVVLRGKDLLNGLFDQSWMSIWLFSITGKLLSQEQVEFWGRMWVICASFPEPRLWNNRVAALAGTAKSTAALAIGAATVVSEAKTYGRQADVGAYAFISKVKLEVDSGKTVDEILGREIKEKHKVPFGFGRPIVKIDERIPAVQRLVSELGVYKGEHYRLAYEIEGWLIKNKYRFRLNVAGISAALAADHGFSAMEYGMIATLAFSAGMIACYGDAVQKTAGAFFPIRCERVDYEGISSRKWEN